MISGRRVSGWGSGCKTESGPEARSRYRESSWTSASVGQARDEYGLDGGANVDLTELVKTTDSGDTEDET